MEAPACANGVAGFLSLSDHSASGNYALFDLVAALHYIRENIAAFGGDADKVTVMGHGHAAALLNLLLISPVAKGRLCSLLFLRRSVAFERTARIQSLDLRVDDHRETVGSTL